MELSWRRVTRTFAALLTLLVFACLTAARAQDADDSSTGEAKKAPPPITQVAGTWIGTDDETGGSGSGGTSSGPMTLDLTQSQKKIGGSFSVTSGDETPVGSVTGKISNDALMLTFHTTGGVSHICNAAVVATVDGDAMSGSFVVSGNRKHCAGRGTFDLEKQ